MARIDTDTDTELVPPCSLDGILRTPVNSADLGYQWFEVR